ncbi:MAG: winged helix-turn-helix domain-containing protein, partial [Bacteroidota bacterium]
MNSLSYIPLYQRLFNYYKQRIVSQDLRAGQKIDSINRMMERHQVSRETAKLVLKKLNNEGLIVTRAGKGSFVTQTTAPKKIWGIVLPFYSSN